LRLGLLSSGLFLPTLFLFVTFVGFNPRVSYPRVIKLFPDAHVRVWPAGKRRGMKMGDPIRAQTRSHLNLLRFGSVKELESAAIRQLDNEVVRILLALKGTNNAGTSSKHDP
jgi:hypothetical protein